jgi:hypothetical protein
VTCTTCREAHAAPTAAGARFDTVDYYLNPNIPI